MVREPMRLLPPTRTLHRRNRHHREPQSLDVHMWNSGCYYYCLEKDFGGISEAILRPAPVRECRHRVSSCLGAFAYRHELIPAEIQMPGSQRAGVWAYAGMAGRPTEQLAPGRRQAIVSIVRKVRRRTLGGKLVPRCCGGTSATRNTRAPCARNKSACTTLSGLTHLRLCAPAGQGAGICHPETRQRAFVASRTNRWAWARLREHEYIGDDVVPVGCPPAHLIACWPQRARGRWWRAWEIIRPRVGRRYRPLFIEASYPARKRREDARA